MGFIWNVTRFKTEIEAKEHFVPVGVSSFEKHARKANKESYSKCALNSFLQRCDKNKKVCVFCNSKEHPPCWCCKYSNPSYKREFLKRNWLCHIYFENGHISNNWSMNYSCNKCHGKHSISLCLQKSGNSETNAD